MSAAFSSFIFNRNVKVTQQTLEIIGHYLGEFSPKTLGKAHSYLATGQIKQLDCIKPGTSYSATVRGTDTYTVEIDFEYGGCIADCTCPVGFDCKHIAAVLLRLQTLELQPEEPADKRFPRKRLSKSANLSDRLVHHLGRHLRPPERAFVGRVQEAYRTARHYPINAFQVFEVVGQTARPAQYEAWQKLHLWPSFPKNEFYFWLHLAWEFRRQGVPLPDFIAGITDLALIEPEMLPWERQQSIAHWRKWFEDFRQAPPPPVASLELRLLIEARAARLQWRQGAEMEFADFKPAHVKRLGESYDRGLLLIDPASLPIWSTTYKPYASYQWWSMSYADNTARPALNRLLRLALDPARIVTQAGHPLLRPDEPLRLELLDPKSPGEGYRLAMRSLDGQSPGAILATFPGAPTLYLTALALFKGPPVGDIQAALNQEIPAAALETSHGLRFLHASGVALPVHLQSRVRNVPVQVTIRCSLSDADPYQRSEDIRLDISAHGEGIPPEHFIGQGWQLISRDSQPITDEVLLVPDRAQQAHFPRLLEDLGAKWHFYGSQWRVRLTKKMPEQFSAWLRDLPQGIEVLLDKQLATLSDEPLSGKISLDVTESGIDWFDLKVILDVGNLNLTQEELKLLLNARGGYVRLGKHGWRRLQLHIPAEQDEQLARLGLNPSDLSGESQRFHALQLADKAARALLPAEQVQKIERRASELQARVAPPLPPAIRADLRPYQTDGFHFLAYLSANRFGGVLADDMGLGKTLQTLAWLAWLRDSAGNDKKKTLASLVICPKSVTDNWLNEASRFYPELRVHVWRGDAPEDLPRLRESAGLIVLNYAQLRSLGSAVEKLPWFATILDEAQAIKNPDSQTAQAARNLKSDHRLALTGTPIENRLLDLWSILAYAMPGVLGTRAQFLRRFDAKDDPLARRRLAARVRPFLLRRTKSQVAKDLPDRVEEDLLCRLEGVQEKLYRAELKRAQRLLLGLKSQQQLNDQRFNVLTSLLRLRQICCHPALVDPGQESAESAKLAALEDLLEPLMEEGHKVLVFSQFVTMLDLLRKKVTERGWRHFYLAGDTENRGQLVQQFQSSSGAAVFLISLKAGGFGLNLTAASYVVLFDPWWNPAVENQAIDRTHRIGQSSKVIAYRLLIRESVEEKIRALQKQKSTLAEDVLGEERFSQSLTLDDLRFLFAD